MKVIYVNCGVKNYLKEDRRSYIRNLCSYEKKAWKKKKKKKKEDFLSLKSLESSTLYIQPLGRD